MKATVLAGVRWLLPKRPRRGTVLCVLALTGLLVLLAGPSAGANDVYSNIGPAPQLPPGGLVGRYPLANYELDQYFPGISVGLTSGVDVSGVAPLIAYFIAQVIWMFTAFVANAVITLFAFAFSLDLVDGNGSPGSGALTPVSTAIHNLYASTFGAPWLVAMVVIVGCWAMWKALVQRRYTETAGALAVSLLYCVLAIGIVTQPERTIGPVSRLSNQLSTALLSLTSQGTVGDESRAKSAASDQLFELLILNPWTVLEFGGIEHCTTGSAERHGQWQSGHSVATQRRTTTSRVSLKTAPNCRRRARRASTIATSTRVTSSHSRSSLTAETASTRPSKRATTKTSRPQTPARRTAPTRSGAQTSQLRKRWARAASTSGFSCRS
jgi:hypothetical protein